MCDVDSEIQMGPFFCHAQGAGTALGTFGPWVQPGLNVRLCPSPRALLPLLGKVAFYHDRVTVGALLYVCLGIGDLPASPSYYPT